MTSSQPKKSRALPLAGVRILVGRARHQASALSAQLRKLGAEIIEIPFIEIHKPRSYKPLDSALRAITDYDWLILTSVNGVEALSARMKHLRISPKHFRHLKIAAIGPATREEIENLGLRAAVVPQRYIAESVVESLEGKVEGKRVLLARAKVARDVIPRELRKMGARVDVVEAYETVVPISSRTRLRSIMKNPKRRPHVVTFTSSSTVKNFATLVGMYGEQEGIGAPPSIRSGGTPANSPALQRREAKSPSPRPVRTAATRQLLEGIHFASIGPITSATLRELGLPVHIEATKYTIPGLIAAIARHKPVPMRRTP
jgi:uroporphyrinogen-III synthase